MNKQAFRLGQTINHPKYGSGKVVGYVLSGLLVRVRFEKFERDFNPTDLLITLQNNKP